MQFLPILD